MPTKGPPTLREAFERRCYLNAVTDPAVVKELWAAEVARREAARKKQKGGKGRHE